MRSWYLLVAAAALLDCRRERAVREPAAADAGPIQVPIAVAEARTVAATLDLTGTLTGSLQAEVTPLVSGRVTATLVERGSRVKLGDPMIRLRDADLRDTAASARAVLEQAKARLGEAADADGESFDPELLPEVRAARSTFELAADALRRDERLAATGAISEAALKDSRTRAETSREQYVAARNAARASYASLLAARAAYDQARRSVADATIRAPFTGEVAERMANLGEYVTPQKAAVTLVQTNPLRVDVPVPQEHAGDVREGQPVEVSVDALGGRSFQGTVRYISAAVNPTSRMLPVEALVPNPEETLRPGFFVRVHLALTNQELRVAVPASAVVDEGDIHRVFVVDGGRAQARSVAVAKRLDSTVLLSSGVAPNERVAAGALDRLTDGAPVTPGP